jgi:hypothetical protein
MTIMSFGGPVGIAVVLRGGRSPNWPPDRLVEWVAFGGTCGLVLGLMALAVALAVANQKAVARAKAERTRADASETAR